MLPLHVWPHIVDLLGAANLIGSGIKTERNDDGSPASSHPAFAAHPIQVRNTSMIVCSLIFLLT